MLPVAILTGDCFVDAATQTAVLALGATMTFEPLSKAAVVALAHRMIDAPSSPPWSMVAILEIERLLNFHANALPYARVAPRLSHYRGRLGASHLLVASARERSW
jgi:hypothetical protein